MTRCTFPGKFNEFNILENAGSMRKDVADSYAEKEYSKFKVVQDRDFKSDFNRFVDKLNTKGKLPSGKKSEEKSEEKMTEFDLQLKGLLNVPPPKKEK